ncbi:MAG: DUF4870 domain-containing protein [Phycisphaerales bacterium]|nr:DUF4870 domain-containing protein [Phycisphaerales bacterium]
MGMTYVTEIDSRITPLVDPAAAPAERQWGVFVHLSGLMTIFTIFCLLIPLVIWLAKRGESPYLDDHGKEAVNFQLSILLYTVVGGILTCGILAIVCLVLNIIFAIKASIAANRGEFYRYPICIRFLS